MNTGLPSVCPGCGGKWSDPTETLSGLPEGAPGDAVCCKCGLTWQEAMLLLWSEVAESYAAAHTAAREGLFAEARRLLAPLLTSPLAGEHLRQLDTLCATALGESVASETNGYLVLACADYEAARCAAMKGNFNEAILFAERCVVSAPCLLPAQKLRMLVLAGAGLGSEAETHRARIAGLFAAEPNVTAWKFAESPTVAAPVAVVRSAAPMVARNSVSRRRSSRPVSQRAGNQQNNTRSFALPIAIGAMAVAAVSLTVSMRRPATVTVPTVPVVSAVSVKPPGLEAGTSPPKPTLEDRNPVLTADLSREWEERRHAAEFAQARSWFNRAVRAKDAGDWLDCDRFAVAAYHLGKNSYLGDESLVLRALAADNSGRSAADRIARYVAIAEETPNSVYAPWALRQAARLAEQQGQKNKAAAYRQMLKTRYPG